MMLLQAAMRPADSDWTGTPADPPPAQTPGNLDLIDQGAEPIKYENNPQPVRGFRLVQWLFRGANQGADLAPAGYRGPNRLFRTNMPVRTTGAPARQQHMASTQPDPIPPFGGAWEPFLA